MSGIPDGGQRHGSIPGSFGTLQNVCSADANTPHISILSVWNYEKRLSARQRKTEVSHQNKTGCRGNTRYTLALKENKNVN